ncbi:MAG: ACT domain-containing protein, partial [Asticcacaulis sp.]
LGLTEAETDTVAWLVRHHLVLSDYAQKRDVRDPDTVASFARIVETPERLRLLLVLTVADIRAVGPGVWNGWKGQLMRELYAATEAAFRGGRGHDPAASVRAELHHRAREIRSHLPGKDTDLTHWLGVMEDAYLCSFSEADLRRHARIVTDATVAGARAESWIDPARNAAALVVATRDRPGLFADLAGIFAPLGASVVGAQVYTSHDGWALDVFYVQDQAGDPFGADAPERLAEAVSRLETAALGLSASKGEDASETRPLPPRLAAFAIAPTVMFDSEASDRATVVEVSGRDRPGLLAELARVLARSGLSIESAHIGVYGERAVDAFYLVDPRTPKPWPRGYRQALRAALTEVLDPPLSGPELVRARASRAE